MDKTMKKTEATFWPAVVGYAMGIVNLAAAGEKIVVTERMLEVFKELSTINFHEADIICAALQYAERENERRARI